MNILDNFLSLPFCFQTLGLTGNKKYENKKEGFKNYLKYSFNRLWKSPFIWGTEPRIRFLAKTGSLSLTQKENKSIWKKTVKHSKRMFFFCQKRGLAMANHIFFWLKKCILTKIKDRNVNNFLQFIFMLPMNLKIFVSII